MTCEWTASEPFTGLLSSKETLIDGMKQIEDLLFLLRAHQVDRPSVA